MSTDNNDDAGFQWDPATIRRLNEMIKEVFPAVPQPKKRKTPRMAVHSIRLTEKARSSLISLALQYDTTPSELIREWVETQLRLHRMDY